MIEPLFATAPSLWTPVPSPGLGWYQTPMGVGNRSTGASGSPFASVPFGMPEISAPALVAAVAAGAGDVDVRCEGGRVTLTGGVSHKRLKHDLGEIAWAIPAVSDVQNNMTLTARRRGRSRDADAQSNAPARKQA